ncbi:MAG TPA: hypothetical protein VIV11_10110 [Kofleriaceae bacterium]
MTKTLTERERHFAPRFDDALRLRDEGDLAGARAQLESLVQELTVAEPRLLSHTHLQLGHIATKLGDNGRRELHFRCAASIAPKLELASLALFHALLANGKPQDAFDEMLRFVTLRDSQLYRELLAEGFGRDLTAADQMTVRRVRSLLAGHRRN